MAISRRRTSRVAFTLIELLVVIAIIAIILIRKKDKDRKMYDSFREASSYSRVSDHEGMGLAPMGNAPTGPQGFARDEYSGSNMVQLIVKYAVRDEAPNILKAKAPCFLFRYWRPTNPCSPPQRWNRVPYPAIIRP